MRFENQQFERGITQSNKSLEQLKHNLNLEGAAKGLNDLDKAGKSFSLSNISSGVDKIASKFSAMSIVGITALQNLTNKAITAGSKIVSSLTIDPIAAGFKEYELKMDSIQTILANTQSRQVEVDKNALQAINDQADAALANVASGKGKKDAVAAIEARRNAQIKALLAQERGMTEGSTLEDVNAALDELNAYADKTIYNFSEMTRNIGTFTAAGVDLDTSVDAIKGIANVAAISGTNAQKTSVAMYQLSQALSKGKVQLQDWMSIENAGMSGKVFTDSILETARVHGIAIDEMILSEGSFRESLKNGWLTTDILLETLSKFTGDLSAEQLKAMGYTEQQIEAIIKMGETANDAATKVKTFGQLMDTLKEAAQSGWANTFQILVGDFEEAKDLLTNISDVVGGFINNMSDARNQTLSFWKENSGRESAIRGLTNVIISIVDVAKTIHTAFVNLFPPITGEQLVALTKGFETFSEKLKLSDDTMSKLTSTFSGVFATVKIVGQALVPVGQMFIEMLSALKPVIDFILTKTAALGDKLTEIANSNSVFDQFNKIVEKTSGFMDKISESTKGVRDRMSDLGGSVKGLDFSVIEAFSEKLETRMGPIKTFGEIVSKTIDKCQERIKKFAPMFYDMIASVGEAMKTLQANILNALNSNDFDWIFDLLNSGIFASLLLGIKAIINSLDKMVEKPGEALDGLVKSFTEFTKKGGKVLDSVTQTLDGVRGCLKAYQSELQSKALLNIAFAVGILSVSLIALSLVDSKKLTVALGGITGLFMNLVVSMTILSKALSSFKFGGLTKLTTSMISMSVAILILSAAMIKISTLDWDGVAKGLVGVAGLCAVLVASSMALSKSSGRLIKGSLGLIAFALAISVLSKSVVKIGEIDAANLAKGLAGVGVLMAELALFMKSTDTNKLGMFKAVGILIFASSLIVMSTAVEKLASINPESITQGLVSLGLILTGISIFLKSIGDVKKVISTSIGITLLASSMLILSAAIDRLGTMNTEDLKQGLIGLAVGLGLVIASLAVIPKGAFTNSLALVSVFLSLDMFASVLAKLGAMSWEEIGRSLVMLGGSLIAMAVGLHALNGTVMGSISLTVFAGALLLLAPALKILASFSLVEIITSLGLLAATLALIAGASYLLTPAIPMILALSAAVLLLGVGIGSIGGGVALLAIGLSGLATAGTAGTIAFVMMAKSMIDLVPMFIEAVGNGFVALIKVIGKSAPAIGEAFVNITLAIIQVFIDLIPKLVDLTNTLIVSMLESIALHTPAMVEAGVNIVSGFIEGLAASIGRLIEATIELAVSFIEGLANGIRNNIDRLLDAVTDLTDAIIEAFIKGIKHNMNLMLNAGRDLMDSGFMQGVKAKITDVRNKALDIVNAIINPIKEKAAAFTQIGKDVVQGMINGIKSMIKNIKESITSVGENIIKTAKSVLGIKSPSRVFKQLGVYTGEGFVVGLGKCSSKVEDASSEMAEGAIDTVKNSLSRLSDVVSGEIDANPTIRPVLDLSNVQNGSKTLGQLFADKSISAAATVSTNINSNRTQDTGSLLRDVIDMMKPTIVDGQKSGSLQATFNIYSPNGNAMEISRQIQKELTHFNRALGSV